MPRFLACLGDSLPGSDLGLDIPCSEIMEEHGVTKFPPEPPLPLGGTTSGCRPSLSGMGAG